METLAMIMWLFGLGSPADINDTPYDNGGEMTTQGGGIPTRQY